MKMKINDQFVLALMKEVLMNLNSIQYDSSADIKGTSSEFWYEFLIYRKPPYKFVIRCSEGSEKENSIIVEKSKEQEFLARGLLNNTIVIEDQCSICIETDTNVVEDFKKFTTLIRNYFAAKKLSQEGKLLEDAITFLSKED